MDQKREAGMLVISNQQFIAMKRQAEASFVGKLSEMLKLKSPEYFLGRNGNDIHREISHMVQDAHSIGLQSERDVGCYVQLCLEFGDKAKRFLRQPSNSRGVSKDIYAIREKLSLELPNQP